MQIRALTDPVEALKIAVPAATTVVAAATIVAVPLCRRAVEHIRDTWNRYSADELRTINFIQRTYKAYCFELEKKKELTTLKIDDNKNESEDSQYPIYFEMTEKNVPVLFQRGFAPKKEVDEWMPYVNKLSPLKLHIEEMMNYICLYQSHRDEMWTGGNYDYDPMTLFWEEFKYWLIMLSKVNFSDDIIHIVRARRKYLDAFYNNQGIFRAGATLPSCKQIIMKVRDVLRDNVEPLIKLAMSRKSSREQFHELKLNVQGSIVSGIELLFYIFRDTDDTPLNFILGEVRKPRIPLYENVINNTFTGALLHHLANSGAFKLALPPCQFELDQQIVKFTFEQIVRNDFINGNNLLLPLGNQLLRADNWWLEDGGAKLKKDLGILKCFKGKDAMDNFLLFHGCLQKLCLFYIICDQLYALSGDGGDLLVYGIALNHVKSSLTAYELLLEEMETIVNKLYRYSEQHKADLTEKKYKQTSNDVQWARLRDRACKAQENLISHLEESRKRIDVICIQMQVKQSSAYLCAINQQLNFLSRLVGIFADNSTLKSKQEVSTTSPAHISFFSHLQKPDMHYAENGKRPRNLKAVARLMPTEASEDEWEDKDHKMIAKNHYRKGEFAEALPLFITMLAEEAEDTSLYIYCADCFVALGDKISAINYLGRLLEKEPEHQQALHRRASLYLSASDLQLAKKDIVKLYAMNPRMAQDKYEEIFNKITESCRRICTN